MCSVGAGSAASEIPVGESRGESVGNVEIENVVPKFTLMPYIEWILVNA
jgi:hypothetical protein